MSLPDEKPPFDPSPFLRRARSAAFLMAVSLLFLAGIAAYALPEVALDLPGDRMDAVVWPLLGVALILILLSSRLRTRVLKQGLAVSRFHPDRASAVLADAYRRATLVSLALLEGAALLGFVLSLLTGSSRYGVIFSLLCLLAMLTRWPREHELRRLLDGRLRP